MDWPIDLPLEYQYALQAETPEQLVDLARKHPDEQIVEFFEWITDDRIWVAHHAHLLKPLVRWLSIEYIHRRLSPDLAQRLSNRLRERYHMLRPAFYVDLSIHVDGKRYAASSLIYGTASHLFLEKIRLVVPPRVPPEIGVTKRYQLKLPDLKTREFLHIHEYVNTGLLHKLAVLETDEIAALESNALAWGLADLAKICARAQNRYIDSNNVVEMLLDAHQNGLEELQRECFEYINHRAHGYKIGETRTGHLFLELTFLNDNGNELIKKIAPWIYEFHCKSSLLEDEALIPLINSLNKLTTINLSHSKEVIVPVLEAFKDLESLELVACPWLNVGTINILIKGSPHIRQLNLSENHIEGFYFFKALKQLNELAILNLSNCPAITNDCLTAIYFAFQNLREFRLTDAQKIIDHYLLSFLNFCPALQILELSRCDALSDKGLSELARHSRGLTWVSLRRCRAVTDGVANQFALSCPGLRHLDLRDCRVTPEMVAKLRKTYAYLEIVV
jgi:hypothetical protein